MLVVYAALFVLGFNEDGWGCEGEDEANDKLTLLVRR